MTWLSQTKQILLAHNFAVDVEGDERLSYAAMHIFKRYAEVQYAMSLDLRDYDCGAREPYTVSIFDFAYKYGGNADILLFINEIDVKLSKRMFADLNRQFDVDLIIALVRLPWDEKSAQTVYKELSAAYMRLGKRHQRTAFLCFQSDSDFVETVQKAFVLLMEENWKRLERRVTEAESSSEEQYLYYYVILARSHMFCKSAYTAFYQLKYDMNEFYGLCGSQKARQWFDYALLVKQQLKEVAGNYLEYEIDNFNESTDYFLKDQLEMIYYCLYCYHAVFGEHYACKLTINIPENTQDREISNIFLMTFLQGYYHIYARYSGSEDVIPIIQRGDIQEILQFQPSTDGDHDAPYNVFSLIDLCKRYFTEMEINFGYDSGPLMLYLFGLYLLQSEYRYFIFGVKLFALVARYAGLMDDTLLANSLFHARNLLYSDPFTKTFKYVPCGQAPCKNLMLIIFVIAVKSAQFAKRSTKGACYYAGNFVVLLTGLYNVFRSTKYKSHALVADLKLLFCFIFIVILKTDFWATLTDYSRNALFAQTMQIVNEQTISTDSYLQGLDIIQNGSFVTYCPERRIIQQYRNNVLHGLLNVSVYLTHSLVGIDGLAGISLFYRFEQQPEQSVTKALSDAGEKCVATFEIACETAGRFSVTAIQYEYARISIKTVVSPSVSQNYSLSVVKLYSALIFNFQFPGDTANGIPFPVRISAEVPTLSHYAVLQQLHYLVKIEQSVYNASFVPAPCGRNYEVRLLDDQQAEITQVNACDKIDFVLLICARAQCAFKLSARVETEPPQFSRQIQVAQLMQIKKRKLENALAFYQFQNSIALQINRIVATNKCELINADAFHNIQFPMRLLRPSDYEKYALLDVGPGFIVKFTPELGSYIPQCSGRLGSQSSENGEIFAEIESQYLLAYYRAIDEHVYQASGVFGFNLL